MGQTSTQSPQNDDIIDGDFEIVRETVDIDPEKIENNQNQTNNK